jgi:hypothetical protein
LLLPELVDNFLGDLKSFPFVLSYNYFIEDGFTCPNPILGDLACSHCQYTTFAKKTILNHLATKHKDIYGSPKKEKNVNPLAKTPNSGYQRAKNNAQ